ncbi:MAG: hypothetical protein IJ323_03875 [Clostridia bacterium]|nr:hypothetical protein [Clostridia bacterium]
MENIIIENKRFILTVGSDAKTKSLILKENGEECLDKSESLSLFSLTEERPFNNEIKLSHPNKKTTFQANSLILEKDRLIVGFELVGFKAAVSVKKSDDYIAFTLDDFIISEADFERLAMTPPPVYEFRLIQLPVKKRESFGEWLNVTFDEKAAVNVLATMPYTKIDSKKRENCRIMYADALRDIKMKGCSAALIVSSPDELLDCIDTLEHDFDLPRGVESRRRKELNASIYWAWDVNPATLDEHLSYAKKGGFSMMLLYYSSFFKEENGYRYSGDFDYNEHFPNGEKDLRAMLDKIKAEGIHPGIHFLQTHIGIKSRYVSPYADHRLNLTRYFTLAKPLGEDDTTLYVEENPEGTVMHPKCRVLKFGTELISYESYTTEQPYAFTGCKRGHFDTVIKNHDLGEIGGILDLSEFGATSVYINQRTSLQDEVGEKLAKAYDAGFEFIYYDGSEGTNPPFEIYIPLAQYKIYEKLKTKPLFTEGAAKAHFSWHFLSGGNAFDIFPMNIFKEKIVEFPLEQAPRMACDFTRLNFGWWAYYNDTQPDIYEYGTSKAASWDCPVTMQSNVDRFKSNPRTDDIFEVISRWEDVRRKNWLTKEQKIALRDPNTEYTLLINEEGEYELTPYYEIKTKEEDLSAFYFERKGKSFVVCWHKTGEGNLTIALDGDAVYEDELGGTGTPFKRSGSTLTLPLSKKRYFSTSLNKNAVIKAFENGRLS